jgi:hypothetical protein
MTALLLPPALHSVGRPAPDLRNFVFRQQRIVRERR